MEASPANRVGVRLSLEKGGAKLSLEKNSVSNVDSAGADNATATQQDDKVSCSKPINRKEHKRLRRQAQNKLNQGNAPTVVRPVSKRQKSRREPQRGGRRHDGCLAVILEFLKVFTPVFLTFVVLPIVGIWLIEDFDSNLLRGIGWIVILGLAFFGFLARVLR